MLLQNRGSIRTCQTRGGTCLSESNCQQPLWKEHGKQCEECAGPCKDTSCKTKCLLDKASKEKGERTPQAQMEVPLITYASNIQGMGVDKESPRASVHWCADLLHVRWALGNHAGHAETHMTARRASPFDRDSHMTSSCTHLSLMLCCGTRPDRGQAHTYATMPISFLSMHSSSKPVSRDANAIEVACAPCAAHRSPSPYLATVTPTRHANRADR